MSEVKKVNKALELIARQSVDRSSQVLSKMIKTGAKIALQDVYISDISEITKKIMEEDEFEIVGTIIDLLGDTPFKFLFYVPITSSLLLADLILRKEIGTTKEFDVYASSAVQEIGNILSSAISNVFSNDFQIKLKPAPPIIVSDFASTVFGEYIMSCSADKNEILFIESNFLVIDHDIKCKMFILPDEDSENILQYMYNSI